MGIRPLSRATERRIALLFSPANQEEVRRILVEECGNGLPFLQNGDEDAVDRIRFAVLKLSAGNLDRLNEAVRLAKTDWRDLLVAAEFAEDIYAHRLWLPASRF